MSIPESPLNPPRMVRPPAEVVYAEELAALAAADTNARPSGWKLSPRAVRQFVVGMDAPVTHTWQNAKKKTVVTQKFYGDDALV
ncbi:MAG TPA: AAA family ATPase, partial [Verrucomicrobiae bacterium]